MVLAKLHHAQVVAKKKNVPIKIILICFFLLPAKENIWAYQNIKYTKDVFDSMDVKRSSHFLWCLVRSRISVSQMSVNKSQIRDEPIPRKIGRARPFLHRAHL
jgi:hypothetical protein